MRWLLLLLPLTVQAQDLKVIQINAIWNKANTADLDRIRGCSYTLAWLEDQPREIQQSITSVPTVVIYKDDRPVWQYAAGIDLRLKVTREEIQAKVVELSTN